MKKENLVIRDGTHFHLRVNGQWHKRQILNDARRILLDAGLDPYKMLAFAIRVPEPVEVDYRPLGRFRWWLNGRPVPVACAKHALREAGCDSEVIAAILHANKLIYDIRRRMKCA